MTISIKPTASGSTIEQDGSTILTVDGSGNITAANNFNITGNLSNTTFSSSNTPVVNIESTGSSPNTGLLVTKQQGSGDLADWNAITINGNDNVSYEARIQWQFDSIANGPVIGGKRTGGGETQLAFHTNSGETLYERMRIDSSGNVLVNSTSNVTFGSGAKLSVQGSGTGIAVGYGTATAQYRIMYMNSGDSTLYFHNNSNYAYLNSAGAWTNASDERLKNNIVDIKYGLDAVLNTQPRSYKMNDVEGDFIGFVAQELQTVIPEVVSGDPEKQLGVDYGSLVAVAFKAIQEQQELIKALEARVATLESN